MKYNCPFCQSKMSYIVEREKASHTDAFDDILIHKCGKSKCKIDVVPKYQVFESKGQPIGFSLIIEYNSNLYKIISWYHLGVTRLKKVKTELGFNYSVNCTYKNILEINQAIKIDLADPINSGLSILNRLMKLRAFS